MVLLACILPIVSWICQPLTNAAQSGLQTAAQRFLSFLGDRIGGEFNSLVTSIRCDVVEVAVSTASIVGAEETLSEIWKHLSEDSVGIIGIYGMGGVGKTTLLQKINNDFLKSGTWLNFNLVIWVSVSKEINIPQIQKQIGDRLGLSFSESESGSVPPPSLVEKQAGDLFTALSKKRFLVLLDDVWEKLDLAKIGIPLPKCRRNCKVAFTTRSLQVCDDMDADERVRVKQLDQNQSWELFRSKLRTDVVLNNPSIKQLAEIVVDRCGGLPLTLITVGKAMASKSLRPAWEKAVKELEKLRGMDDVLSCLKFSYDRLENDKMRSALLYCAMYPEDHNIDKEELIEHWWGEGLLDSIDIDGARGAGHELISNLQDVCLLEAGIRDAELTVRMHDAVRDMAMWVANTSHDEYGKADDVFLVINAKSATKVITRMMQRQEEQHVKRIWMCKMELLRASAHAPCCIPNCPNCWTLLLTGSDFGPSVPQGIFKFMRAIRVLNLRSTRVVEIPVEMSMLVELRYLNLSWTKIRSLPRELGNLVKLRLLMLEGTDRLQEIPREAIVGLLNLQVLNMWHSGYSWGGHGKARVAGRRKRTTFFNSSGGGMDAGGRQLELGDLEGLDQLQELHVHVSTPHGLERIVNSNKLCKCMRRLSSTLKKNSDDAAVSLQEEEGGSLLQMVMNKMGGYLRVLRLVGNKSDSWVGELRFRLDQLPCLEELRLIAFTSTTSTLEVVLVGSSVTNSVEGGRVMASINRLRVLGISFCAGLKELRFIGSFHSIQRINLLSCANMVELVLMDDEEVEEIGRGRRREENPQHLVDNCRLPMLEYIKLVNLPALKSICRGHLLLPSLENVDIAECPELRQLPLAAGNTPKLRKIKGEQEWWDKLEWGSTNIKDIFSPFFTPM